MVQGKIWSETRVDGTRRNGRKGAIEILVCLDILKIKNENEKK